MGWWNIFNSEVGPLARALNAIRLYYRFEPEKVCDIIIENVTQRELIFKSLLDMKSGIEKEESINEEKLANYIHETYNQIFHKGNEKKSNLKNVFSELKHPASVSPSDQSKLSLSVDDRSSNYEDEDHFLIMGKKA